MNYPATHILRVVEENIDGCGSDAVMYVEFSRMLDAKIQEHFQAHLRSVKRITAKGDTDASDLDTEEMVNTAVKCFNNSRLAREIWHVQAEVCDAPYFGVVTF